MSCTRLLLASTVLLSVSSGAFAQRISFTWLDESYSALDLTPDGKYVVGGSPGGSYIWSLEDGYRFVPGGNASAISDDGTTLFGTVTDPETSIQEAAVWTEATGWQLVGGLRGTCDFFLSTGYELSADGSVGVGLGWQGCSGQGFRWTEASGIVGLEHLANGGNRASVVSADGAIAGGFAQGSFSRTPAIWFADGSGALLDPPNGDVSGEVRGISDDGTIVLGNWNGDAFYRTEAEGVVTFATTISSWVGAATDIADDGTIVGFDFIGVSRQAWIKLPDTPTRLLAGYLQDLGLVGGPTHLEVAQAISADGCVIIGHNAFASGYVIHVLPDPDFDGDGAVAFGDLLILLSVWGPCGDGDCPADLDKDGTVDFADLLVLLSNWG